MFAVNVSGINWPRGVMFLDVVLVPVIVAWATGHEQYVLSAIFGALLAVLVGPGGSIRHHATRLTWFGLLGAGVTALGFGLGGVAWGWLVTVSFAVTLLAGLAIAFGVQWFVAGLLLNLWFVIAIAVGVNLHHRTGITSHVWGQVAAFVAGTALWIVVTFIAWLLRGRQDLARTVPELPGDSARRKLTPPLVMFAVIRAVAIGGCVAIGYGFGLSHAEWLPIAALIAMKPSLEQTTLVAAQRLTGAVIGAVAAGLLLLVPAAEHGLRLYAVDQALEVVAIIILLHAVAVRFWNYAVYSAAIAAAVLILVDLPQPTDYSAEGDRVLWTLIGVAIGVLLMLVAGLFAKHSGNTPSQPAS